MEKQRRMRKRKKTLNEGEDRGNRKNEKNEGRGEKKWGRG